MDYVVSVSGGCASAVALSRAKTRADAEDARIHAVFADTRSEDADLYRFLGDIESYLGVEITRLADGRDLWQLFRDEGMMGSNRFDLCSRILKRELLDRWRVDQGFRPESTCLVFGFGAGEASRLRRLAARLKPWSVWTPLLDEPAVSSCGAVQIVEDDWGLDAPDLYHQGFRHNNCGGACVKAGHGQWYHLLRRKPDLYEEWASNEEVFRQKVNKDVSILRDRRGGQYSPLTLRQLAARITGPEQYRPADLGGCDCMGLLD